MQWKSALISISSIVP